MALSIQTDYVSAKKQTRNAKEKRKFDVTDMWMVREEGFAAKTQVSIGLLDYWKEESRLLRWEYSLKPEGVVLSSIRSKYVVLKILTLRT